MPSDEFIVLLCLHQVALLGLDLLSALVTRLQERFRAHVGTGKSEITTSLLQYFNTVYLLLLKCDFSVLYTTAFKYM